MKFTIEIKGLGTLKDILDNMDEVKSFIENKIEEGEDKFESISYEMFVMPLVKAVQELSAKNEALLTRIEALEG